MLFDFGFDDDVRLKGALLALCTHFFGFALRLVSFFQRVCLRYLFGCGRAAFRVRFRLAEVRIRLSYLGFGQVFALYRR